MSVPESRELVYYKDKNCLVSFPFVNGTQVLVSPNAVRLGEKGRMVAYLRNETKNEFDIIGVVLENSSVSLGIDKKVIQSGEIATIDIEWVVPKNQETAFKVGFTIEGDFIITD